MSASRKGAEAPPRPDASSGPRAVLTVDLGKIASNYRLLEAKLSGARMGCVVKADAYGLGLSAVAPALAACGCRDFFVAGAEEGMALRRLLGDARIYVLNGPSADSLPEFARYDLIPVMNDLGQIEAVAEFARANWALPVAIHIDTGMSRLGLPPDEVDVLAAAPGRLAGMTLACVISHLACADEPGNPKNAEQLQAFNAARARLPKSMASMANSSGVFLGPQYHLDLVRAGGALYGLQPMQSGPNPLAQVLRLEAPILQVRDVDSPMTVGYGAGFRVAKRGRIATVPVGYADGYLRSLGNRGSAYLGGIRIPVVGRVSMDLITLDVSDVPAALAHPGALVELVGDTHSVDDLADEAGTIGHDILTGFGPRIVRRYLGGSGNAGGA